MFTGHELRLLLKLCLAVIGISFVRYCRCLKSRIATVSNQEIVTMSSYMALSGSYSRGSRDSSPSRMGALTTNRSTTNQNMYSQMNNQKGQSNYYPKDRDYYVSHPSGIPMYNCKKSWYSPDMYSYIRSLMSRFSEDYEKRREIERYEEESRMSNKKPYSQSYAASSMEHPKVELVEFYARDNSKEHHTEMYEVVMDNPPQPVLRRGQNFFMAMRFRDKSYDSRRDRINLVFSFGPSPSVPKGTKVVLPISGNKEFRDSDKFRWDAKIHQSDGNTMTIQVQIPPTAPVGIWKCTIETFFYTGSHLRESSPYRRSDDYSYGGRSSTPDRVDRSTSSARRPEDYRKDEYRCREDVYILFNPWCRDDPVHMDNDMWRREYVLNENGKIWMGTYKRNKGRRWAYGQFDDIVLPACMYLLEMAELNHNERGNPIKVVRAISHVIHGNFMHYNNDENGVMEAKWDGNFEDGVAPTTWTGSVKILEEYMRRGGKPVKYGQCWVFAGIVTTICRALGIPCRPVTNFVSAHDTNKSMTIDKYFDMFGERIEGGPDGDSSDTVWNYHVWNDVWMSRPDLPMGYGGWQAIDATPQRDNDNYYRCGPASLEAIRRGEIGLSYDTPFKFCELNSEVMHWQEDPESEWGYSYLRCNNYQIGRQILTKRPDREDDDGDDDFEDITYMYKNKEGSDSERFTVFGAIKGSERYNQYSQYMSKNTTHEDVSFDLVEIERVQMGQPFNVTINIQNRSHETRTVNVNMSVNSVYYTGMKARPIKQQQMQYVLRANQRETLTFRVMPEEYLEKMVDQSMIKVYAVAFVRETRQGWCEEDDFMMEKPRLNIQTRGNAQVGQELQVTFSFVNPLTVPLTDCKFFYEGPGIQRPKCIRYREVKPGEMVSHMERFVPKRPGERKVVGSFYSQEMSDITGYRSVSVRD